MPTTEKAGPAWDPSAFLGALSELVQANTFKDSAVAKVRGVHKRMDKMGVHKRALNDAMYLRGLEQPEAEAYLMHLTRYVRAMDLDVGKQLTLFSDDAAPASDRARVEWNGAQAYEEGFDAGRQGRASDDTRFPAGGPLYSRFYEGWIAGQGVIAAEMGVERKDGETLKRTSGRAKDGGAEVATASPRGRGRRRRTDEQPGA